MRLHNGSRITSHKVHQWTLQWLVQAKLLKDHGWLCTATVVWSIVLRAAANRSSVYAACRDLALAPSDTAVFKALVEGLPRTLSVLEQRLNKGIDGQSSSGVAAPRLEDRNRLAFGTLLRPTAQESQRTLLWQTGSRNDQVSRVCIRLHRAVRSSLHLGPDVDPTSRNHRNRFATSARANSRPWRKNQVFVARPGFLQRTGYRVFEARTASVFDAGRDSRTPPQKGNSQDGFALDQKTTSRLVFAHVEKWQTTSTSRSLRSVSNASQPQRWQMQKAETSVCCVACTRLADSNPRTVSQTFRNREQLPTTPPGTHLHLYAQSSLASGLLRHCTDTPQHVGLDSCCNAGRGARRQFHAAPRSAAIHTHARLDCTDCRPRTSRWFNTLRPN